MIGGPLEPKEFGTELARLGITVQWFCDNAGIDQSTMWRWRHNVVPVPQWAIWVLQLLDRLAWREGVRDLEDDVERFIKLMATGTLVPPSGNRTGTEKFHYSDKEGLVNRVIDWAAVKRDFMNGVGVRKLCLRYEVERYQLVEVAKRGDWWEERERERRTAITVVTRERRAVGLPARSRGRPKKVEAAE